MTVQCHTLVPDTEWIKYHSIIMWAYAHAHMINFFMLQVGVIKGYTYYYGVNGLLSCTVLGWDGILLRSDQSQSVSLLRVPWPTTTDDLAPLIAWMAERRREKGKRHLTQHRVKVAAVGVNFLTAIILHVKVKGWDTKHNRKNQSERLLDPRQKHIF